MDPYVNLNGSLVPAAEARLSIFDHGLLYGDGLFETLRVHGGRFFRLEAHLARLEQAAALIDLPLPWGADALAQAVRETVRASGLEDGVVRLTVTRGEGPALPDPDVCGEPAYFVTLRPPAGAGWQEAFEKGQSLGFGGPHPRAGLPGIKSLSYLQFQQERREARRKGYDDALLMSGHTVVESTVANLFILWKGALLTPGLNSGCLPGITRAAILEVVGAAGIEHHELPLHRRLLESAQEIFLTSSVSGVMPVVQFEGWPVGDGSPGPVTRRLHDEYRRLVQAELAE